jgi:hypothetical protein
MMRALKIFVPACLFFTLAAYLPAAAQEENLISPYITFQYFKNSDNQSSIQTTLTYSSNRMELPLGGMKISFYSTAGKKELLAAVITDERGVARYIFPGEVSLPINSDGAWNFLTEYKGNDTIEAASAELSIMNMNLEVTAAVVDTIKTLTITASAISKGEQVPLAGEIVLVYVPRMFSMLPLAEATLDDSGTALVEFPADLPGDSLGNLKIVARIEENPLYGNVETITVQKWGIASYYTPPKIHRALWSKEAPVWMIITLTILLAGVWGHYIFAVVSLILIKIDANRKKAKEEYRL